MELEKEGVFRIEDIKQLKYSYDNGDREQMCPGYFDHRPFNSMKLMSISANGDTSSFWEPEVYINDTLVTCLVDNGASCCVIASECLDSKAFEGIRVMKTYTDKELSMADQTIQRYIYPEHFTCPQYC